MYAAFKQLVSKFQAKRTHMTTTVFLKINLYKLQCSYLICDQLIYDEFTHHITKLFIFCAHSCQLTTLHAYKFALQFYTETCGYY